MNQENQVIIEEQVNEALLQENSARQSKKYFLEKFIPGVLLGLVFFLPFFFLPLEGVFVGVSKNLLLSVGVISLLVLTLFLWIQKEVFVLPKNSFFWALLFLSVVYSFSSLLSGNFSQSFFGLGAETTASFEFILLSLLAGLFAVFFRTRELVFRAFMTLFVSSLFVFLFQIFHLIFPGAAVSLGIPGDKTFNLIGTWGDFGIFCGVIILLSLVALEYFPSKKPVRVLFFIALFCALFFHALILYSNSWLILGIISLTLSVSLFFFRSNKAENGASSFKKWLSSPSFIIAVVSFLLVFVGAFVNNKLFDILKIPPVQEVRPSWSGTYQVAHGTLFEKPLASNKEAFFGVGPNRFFIPWQKYRPADVNYTPWWNVDFNEGVGTIPSAAITTGILGMLGWAALLFSFFIGGLYAIRKKIFQMDTLAQFGILSSFFIASYCFVASFFTVVGTVSFSFAFVFSGIFFGSLSPFGISHVREHVYGKDPQKGFTLLVVLLLLLGISLATGYLAFKRVRAFFAYREAVIAGNSGDFERAKNGLLTAIRFTPKDFYYRSFSALNSYQSGKVVLQQGISPEELREQFGSAFRASVDGANKAIQIDGANYQNWLALAEAHAVLAPLAIPNVSDDAYVRARDAYEEAGNRNPFNPQIPYTQAKLALAKKLPDEALGYLQKSIELKNDYAEALILKSQIEDGRGNINDAIATMEKGAAINSSDPSVLFQLGYLRYKNGSYKEAVTVLERAVQIVPNYANAKYFLGLSYFQFGRTKDALGEFIDIKNLNPEREDIAEIIANLGNGYDPLLGAGSAELSFENASTTDELAPRKKR